ncbi:MAG TPA: phosphate ABC transporter permease subunit PstC [Armatimonadota bacterium]|jgi:phosphate transport system permease protein
MVTTPTDSRIAVSAKRKRRKAVEVAAESVIWAAGVLSVILVALIFIFLLRDALPLLKTHSLWSVLTGRAWYPTDETFGFMPLIVGSALVTLGAVAVAVPIGVAAAIYVGEIAPARVREVLKPAIEMVAAVPSVVIGFIGLVVLGPLLQNVLHLDSGTVALTGSVMLAFMALPTIVSIAEDALATVPRDFRAGSLALGATSWQTVWRVQLPAAKSGIVAAVMLGIGRAIGETMTVLMVTGNAFAQTKVINGQIVTVMPYTLFQSVRTMTATIAAEMGETVQYSTHYNALFMLGVVLFAITFVVNLLADIALHRMPKHG